MCGETGHDWTFRGGRCARDEEARAVVFMTRTEYRGDLATEAGTTTGLAGGDALCDTVARSAELPGTFRAWLSTPSADAIDRIGGEGPWYLVDGGEAFPNRAALTTSANRTIDDEEGKFFSSGSDLAWSGTDRNGRRDGPRHCEGWSSRARTAEGSLTDEHFDPGAGTSSCDETHHLLCFQQPEGEGR